MSLGKGQDLVGHMVFNAFTITEVGMAFLEDPHSVSLPTVHSGNTYIHTYIISLNQIFVTICLGTAPSLQPEKCWSEKETRKGKGCQTITIIRTLMESREKWYAINNEDDYHFPGVFTAPYPQKMGFCEDIMKLAKYDSKNEHFLFTDVQLSKGCARNPRKVTMNVNSTNEQLWYRIIPCGGVKLCERYSDGCTHVVSIRESTKCPNHPDEKLISVQLSSHTYGPNALMTRGAG